LNGATKEGQFIQRLLDDDWLPCILNNQVVAVEFSVPFNFSIGNR
jgi:hypothetical protein